jgi:aarF domain-containing kinase
MMRLLGEERLASFRSRSQRDKLVLAGKSLAALGVTSAVAFYWPEIEFVGATLGRGLRTASTLAACTVDYRRHYPFEGDQPLRDDECQAEELSERRRQRAEVHGRAAERLLRLFRRNGGIYIKLGQHMAALEHILPLEYSATMAVLHNRAPASSMADVEAVVREELGCGIAEIFASFEEEPIGAASLAQVHRATLRSSGQAVAVKVQHHRLQAFVDMDMFTVSVAAKLVKRLFPQFAFEWLADEMRTNLPKELDFVAEAHNAERTARNIRRTWPASCPIHVPAILWEWTRKRVLVMEYCAGATVTDVGWMRRNAVDPAAVGRDLTRLYAQMIFLHGFVHCDPHPGNVAVRVTEDAEGRRRAQIILLDHGLYRELPDAFRLTYARLWRALIEGDEPGIRRHAEALGGGDAYKLFSTVLTHRSWDSMVADRDWDRPRKAADVERFRERASEYIPVVAELLGRLPRPLILLLKTNDLLRAVDRALHAEAPGVPSPTFLLMGRCCVEAINEDRWAAARGSLRREARAVLCNLRDSLRFWWAELAFAAYARLMRFKTLLLPAPSSCY